MNATSKSVAVLDEELAGAVFQRLADDLAMIVDRKIAIGEVRAERSHRRIAGAGTIHISFMLGLQQERRTSHGCILVPLPEAISLASFLMMLPDDLVEQQRGATELDRPMKDAMLELGNFLAGAVDAVFRRWYPDELFVRPEGCQGVRADVRPAFPYEEGSELFVARARASVASFPEFELILMLPARA
jgi:hypothetical protein